MSQDALMKRDGSLQERSVAGIQGERAMQEVKAMIWMAKSYPRDETVCIQRILKACERRSLAEGSTYEYPRGGVKVIGPSIRLAEVIAQNWWNIDFGIRELSQEEGSSEVEAYAWDLETNVRQTKTFAVPHLRYKKGGKSKKLDDPRDIYEMVANQGARRLRACILGIIPGDIVEAAVERCEETLAKIDQNPLEKRVAVMIEKFAKFGVMPEMIEAKLGHNLDAITQHELINLGKIHNSLRDGMSKVDDWFEGPLSVDKDAVLQKAAEFDKVLSAGGFVGDDVDDFIKRTANSLGKTVEDVKAMALDEQSHFFKTYSQWKEQRPYTAPEDPMQRDEGSRKRRAGQREDGPEGEPENGEDKDDDKDDGPDIFESNEWNELVALSERYPEIYKNNISLGRFKLKSIKSISMAIDKMNAVVEAQEKGEGIPDK